MMLRLGAAEQKLEQPAFWRTRLRYSSVVEENAEEVKSDRRAVSRIADGRLPENA
jgi:hypothetical protein